MSYGCMFLVRNPIGKDELCAKLVHTSKNNGYAINFFPINNLLLTKSVIFSVQDLIFEVCDNLDSKVAALLLSYDGYCVNGKQANIPLKDRLILIQEIAKVCLSQADEIEIYFGEDTPYLPDYSNYSPAYTEIADILYQEYQSNDGSAWIPCVHIRIRS